MNRKDIRFLVMDVDGTLTDGKIYMGSEGEMLKAFNIKDGCGIKEILPKCNIIPVIITGRESEILKRRCEELDITEVYQGMREKLSCLQSILSKWSTHDNCTYTLRNVAYIGDDVPDLSCMIPIRTQGGLTACPSDAVQKVVDAAEYVCLRAGGDGAVREVIDYLIAEDCKIY